MSENGPKNSQVNFFSQQLFFEKQVDMGVPLVSLCSTCQREKV
jgi:hypothetical protein